MADRKRVSWRVSRGFYQEFYEGFKMFSGEVSENVREFQKSFTGITKSFKMVSESLGKFDQKIWYDFNKEFP